MRIAVVLLMAMSAYGQTVKLNPFTGMLDLVGSSGGSTSISGLTDLKVTVSSGTAIAIAAGTNVRGSVATAISAATATITAGSGSGTAMVYISEGDVIVVEHPTAAGLSITCTGCTASQVTTPAIPANSRYLASVTISSGAWGTATDKRGFSSRPLVSGTGISITDTGGVATVNIDTADVPRLGGNNVWTGTNTGLPGASFIQRSTAQSFDEFLPTSTSQSSIGGLGWAFFGSGGVATVNQSAKTHPGVYRVISGGAANDQAGYRLDSNSDAVWHISANEASWDSIFIFKPVFTGSQSHVLVGWMSEINDLPANGLYARVYNSSSGCTANNNSESTFQFVARASSTSTSSASTQTVTSDTWYSLRIRSTTNGTVLFSLAKNDGTPETEVSIASNVPSTALQPVFQIITCDTNTVQMHADYWAWERTGLTR